MTRPLLIGTVFLAWTSCNNSDNSLGTAVKTTVPAHSFKAKTENKKENYRDSLLKTIPKNPSAVFGYRFIIKGDFNGDGKTETLTEHFFSGKDKKETNKFYDSLDFNQLVILTVDKDPISFVSCDSKKTDTLFIHSGGQLLGLSFLKNEGDLDGDGGDEISYVINWADWSSLNTCHLMTFKNNKWQELYSFGIWDWQLPDLPETFNEYGLFGLQDKIINTKNDTVNQRLAKELNNFPGFIKKIKNNKFQLRFRNDEAMEDTAVVDLKK